MLSKPLITAITPARLILMLIVFTFFLLFISHFLGSSSSAPASLRRPSSTAVSLPPPPDPHPFSDLISAFKFWDSHVGCPRFVDEHAGETSGVNATRSLQVGGGCGEEFLGKQKHVSVLVKGWTWIPDNLDNLYSCRCGMTCLWTKSPVLADKPDALLFESSTPPIRRRSGDPLRVYMDLEAGRKKSGREDLFISYHAKDDVQATYAGSLFHNGRNYHVSPYKNNDTLVYWSSSRCLPQRNDLATGLLKLLPYHSFGKCLNNVGGLDMALSFYPECANDASIHPKWWDHLHCAMSHYKFVLAIENTWTESYVTEKLFYALDSGSVPIYFGAPNVMDFVPPHSIIDGNKFGSLEELANYVKSLANDPIAYAEYHAWRRCGVLGNYWKTRSASLDTLPCRLCEAISWKGGRNAKAS
ncbi:hypothetical protein MLD38_001606 [Melastoma candidum]|uniref:Uncharacterized protein n=1 Tax=Melastoma candidum TaxID=119954 RepID=A0ACB9SHQ5_9MYRT|nr:hypothetical protein MLD38_001606 [Melastoma candidum]